MASGRLTYWRNVGFGVAVSFCLLGQTAQAQDEIGHWTFDDGAGLVATDAAGASDGTLINMDDGAWSAGFVGGALSFDGQDDYVTVDDSDAFDIFTDHTWGV